jgi:hypothetical protein
MKRLLKYYLKKRITIIGIISLIVVILGALIIGNSDFISNPVNNTYPKFAINSPLWLVVWTGAILATIVPAFEFYFKMRKVSVDEFYQLPIKREGLYICKCIIGLIETLIPTIIAIITVSILIAVKEHMFNVSFLIPYYFSIIGLVIVYYTTVVFVYTRCNTFFDGLINILLWSFLGVVIYAAINAVLKQLNVGSFGDATYFFIQSPLTVVHVYFDNMFMNNQMKFEPIMIVSVVLFTVIGIASGFLTLYLLKYDKAEDSMQKSNSWFSYKTLIPVYLGFLTAYTILDDLEIFVVMPIILVCSYIGYVIYNRSFKISKKDLIVFGSTFISSLAISIIINCILNSVLV